LYPFLNSSYLNLFLLNLYRDTDIHPMEAACLQIIYAVVDPRQANQLETHSIMEKMIGETIRMAKGKGFEAVIFTTYDLFVTVS